MFLKPVSRLLLLDFFEWIRRTRPTIQSLYEMERSDFVELAAKYEEEQKSNSIRRGKLAWRETFNRISDNDSFLRSWHENDLV